MAKSKQQKETDLTDLTEKLGRMKSIVLSGYRGMTVKSLSTLRGKLRESDIEYKVLKKTLIQKAVNDAGIEGLDVSACDGPTAIAISFDDEVAPAKIIKDYSKEDENLKIFSGVMEGTVLDKKQVVQLASLPSLDELRAKFLGSAMAPVSGFVRCAKGPLSGFYNVVRELQSRAS